MNRKELLPQTIGLTLGALPLAACGTPQPTPTPVPTATPVVREFEPADIGPGKGARHSSAAKMSAEAQCLAITVSQDGPISMHDCGQRALSL